MKAKRFAIILAALTMLMGTAGMSAYANEEVLDTVEEAEVIEVLEEEEIEMFDDVAASVAKVGDTEYATIDEALANWTHNTTLTLLADVTLANTITLNSNEMHTLELGDFTMSTATGKTAIKFSVKGRGSAGTTLIINATADGGINAGTVINYSNTNKNLQDRSIIKVNGGTYNGNISINCPNNTNAAQLHITQGTFNGTISGRSPLVLISGGVFNKKVSLSVASNSYAQITGGRFYDLYSDSDLTNKEKFFFGTNASARGDYSGVDVYVDSDGYYVVTKNIDNNKPENFEASVSADTIATKYNASTHWNGFKSNMGLFEYTKSINEGLFYKDAAMALTQNTLGTVILYTEAD
ncbi:MAG: hypothetical protein IKU43_00955, partial [Clostridia bacterium]|nr:hypothetical protein [Clostridia bacterium]